MEHHPNQNAFTWKKMKLTVCFTAQYKSVIMMDFKVKEGAENVNTKHSWFFYFDEKPDSKGIAFAMENSIQDQTSETTKHAGKLLPSFSSSCDIGEVFTNG